ncbi:hypothetical protein TRFO_40805 [Tritrichomonas foetus]|uniref:DDE-1 domain-containing protein n=1 Tax=Tritrichomonas foetus TaxID=1144522 RepID=A0A1J4J419_9EUKA|nr:hypothetical protein TRFO_40805 [Tritrichomonas foetus]|eukprot:OHS92895.1 hypothetical protein TRFO_40805 [Tritrichomonas foetus]
MTVLASITASGTKLPLLFIVEVSTERCENTQIGDISYHWETHTSSEWMTSELFSYYLMKLREFNNDDDPLYLIVDFYVAHLTLPNRDLAINLKIELLFIPPGHTDLFQPLDRSAFEILKGQARRLFCMRGSNLIRRTKSNACTDVIYAWERLSSQSIENAWDIYKHEQKSSNFIVVTLAFYLFYFLSLLVSFLVLLNFPPFFFFILNSLCF